MLVKGDYGHKDYTIKCNRYSAYLCTSWWERSLAFNHIIQVYFTYTKKTPQNQTEWILYWQTYQLSRHKSHPFSTLLTIENILQLNHGWVMLSLIILTSYMSVMTSQITSQLNCLFRRLFRLTSKQRQQSVLLAHWGVSTGDQTQIAKFVGPTWGPPGPRWAPCWPHEPCYQGWIPLTEGH